MVRDPQAYMRYKAMLLSIYETTLYLLDEMAFLTPGLVFGWAIRTTFPSLADTPLRMSPGHMGHSGQTKNVSGV